MTRMRPRHGFRIFTSNRAEALVEKLAEVLRTSPLSLFQKEVVVVQSKGMERWIHLELAQRNGISANLDFPFPRRFLYRVFREVLDLPESSPFSPDILTWKLMDLLPGVLDRPVFKHLNAYLAGDNRELKLFQVSERLAHLFDQYLIYRPDFILEWEAGKCPAAMEHSAWQAELWRRLSGTFKERDLHHAALHRKFLKEIAGKDALKGLPERICVFGISSLPPAYMEIFSALAQGIEVIFFYLNPCREHWEFALPERDIARFTRGEPPEGRYFETGNPLLASMGRAGREFFSLMLGLSETVDCDLFQEPGRGTMLASIQSDILNLTEGGGNSKIPVSVADRSIQIHSCHSAIREVEVLHDTLLGLFEDKPGLLPKDIVVMTPDISAYAPLIQAIFDTPGGEAKRIPYTMADRNLRVSGTLADAFLSLLRLDKRRFRAPEVLDLLQNDAVRRKFRLTEKDRDILSSWVRETGIRWGVDGDYRKGLGLPGFQENSWAFGLDRMLLGYALPPDGARGPFQGILPYGEIEGDLASVFTHFLRFTEALFTRLPSLRGKRTPREWSHALAGLLEDFFEPDEGSEEDLKAIRGLITEKGLEGIAEKSGFAGRVPLAVIRSWLKEKMESVAVPREFLGRGVTFCTMLPMRSIPFRVVCLLGMNEYPRREPAYGFDLMRERKRPCDRSKRHEDRYIFLEALLSARETLVISFQGQSLKDNTEIPPSTLVSELIDYLHRQFETEKGGEIIGRVLQKHALQPFSPRYFTGDPGFFSYSEENCRAGRLARKRTRVGPAFISRPLPPVPGEGDKGISLDQVAAFLRNPSEYFLRNRLKISLRPGDSLQIEDREPFEPDNLSLYLLREELLNPGPEKDRPSASYEAIRASGRLPHGGPGRDLYKTLQREAGTMAAEVREALSGEALSRRAFTLEFEERDLRAVLSNLYSGGLLLFRCAKVKARDRLCSWVHHLALCSLEDFDGQRQTLYIGTDGKVLYSGLEKDRARKEMARLMGLVRDGLMSPACFFPETSYAYAREFLKTRDRARAQKKALQRWEGQENAAGEKEDESISLCFSGSGIQSEAFPALALDILGPMLRQEKE